TIEYPNGAQAPAKAVAAAVPGAQLVQTSSVKRVTLVLGSNGVQARGLGATHAGGSAGAGGAGSGSSGSSGKKAAAPPPGQPDCIN
ncbi:MAG TPA: hypothetical protein VGL21_00005, partial [Jatrophihabitantaceae bacterium]